MRLQIVRSEPSRVLMGVYTTKSGQTKNRYTINSNSKPLKTIKHIFSSI